MRAAVSFFLGFLAVGIIGVGTMTSFEPLPSERIGASAFLYLLGLTTSISSTLLYRARVQALRRYPGWFTGLLGGVVAAGAFCAPMGADYWLGSPSLAALILTLTLPILTGWLWPYFSARVPAPANSN
jgi:hypothetical protein